MRFRATVMLEFEANDKCDAIETIRKLFGAGLSIEGGVWRDPLPVPVFYSITKLVGLEGEPRIPTGRGGLEDAEDGVR